MFEFVLEVDPDRLARVMRKPEREPGLEVQLALARRSSCSSALASRLASATV